MAPALPTSYSCNLLLLCKAHLPAEAGCNLSYGQHPALSFLYAVTSPSLSMSAVHTASKSLARLVEVPGTSAAQPVIEHVHSRYQVPTMSGKQSEVVHIRSSSDSNPWSVEEGENTLYTATRGPRSRRTIPFSKRNGVGDHYGAGCRGDNQKVASDALPRRNRGLLKRCVPPVIFSGKTRPPRCSSTSKKTASDQNLAGPDLWLGESFFYREDAEPEDDKLARPPSPLALVETDTPDPSVSVMDSDDLERPTGQPVAAAPAQDLSRGPALPTEDSSGRGVGLRGGALSSIHFWNAEACKMLLLGQDGPYKNELVIGSISIDQTIHDYVGGARVQVHIRSTDHPHFDDEPMRLDASHHPEELIIAKTAFRHTFARASRQSERLGRLAKVAETFIVSACFTLWHNDVFWGIEIPTEHVWMVQELCTERWRITHPDRRTANAGTAVHDRRAWTTDGHVEEQVRDVIAADVGRQVEDDTQAMGLLEAHTEDDIPELETTAGSPVSRPSMGGGAGAA